MQFKKFWGGLAAVSILISCQAQSPVKKMELIFPWSAKHGNELEKAFEGGGILLKIIAENPKGDENLSFRIHSSQEMEEVVLPAQWFQEEHLHAIEVEVELILDELKAERNKHFWGRLVLDPNSSYRPFDEPFQIFLQEQAF